MAFVSELDYLQTCRVYTPERSEIKAISLWELDVVLLDVSPPAGI